MDSATSYSFYKAEIKQWIIDNFNTSARILDVGAGSGTYYHLLHDTFTNIDGVEVYKQNIIDYDLTNKYNHIYNTNIIDFTYDYYDLIIFGDVLEHLSVEDAQSVLNYAYNKCKNFIVAVPYNSKQDKIDNNVYEIHIQDDLNIVNIQKRYPYLQLLYGNGLYGYYIKR